MEHSVAYYVGWESACKCGMTDFNYNGIIEKVRIVSAE